MRIFEIKKNVSWCVCVITALIIATLINKFIFFRSRIPSSSMYPTLKVGDELLIKRIYSFKNIKRGDILVFNSKELGELLIKRVIGFPGDKIVIDDGTVYVNGKKINEPYKVEDKKYVGKFTFKVPKDSYFFLGDNRPESFDSRYWKDKYINKDEIIGKAWIRVKPLKNLTVFRSDKH